MSDSINPVKLLLAKEVDRREFLAHIGAVGLGIIGITGLMKILTDPHGRHSRNGYGSSSYGGGTANSSSIDRRSGS